MVASAQTEQSQNAAAKSPGSGAPAEPDESVFTVRKTVNEVHLVFTVTDKHGHYIKDLKKNDFKILDDSKPPEEILSFSSETDLPLQVGLLIDASESVSGRFKFEQEAAIEFLKQTIRRKYDQAFVIGFDLTPKVTQDFTDDPEKLLVGIRTLRPGSLTAMYDALYYACRDKLLKQPQAGPVRRVIILLSDGNDKASSVTREKAIEMAQRAEVSVYTISTNPSRLRRTRQQDLGTHCRSNRREIVRALPDHRSSQRVHRHSRRAAQPVRGVLQAGGVQDRWALPHHQSSSAEPERPAHLQP